MSECFSSGLIVLASTNCICSLIIPLDIRFNMDREHYVITDVVILVRLEVIDKIDAFVVIDKRISNNLVLWIIQRYATTSALFDNAGNGKTCKSAHCCSAPFIGLLLFYI